MIACKHHCHTLAAEVATPVAYRFCVKCAKPLCEGCTTRHSGKFYAEHLLVPIQEYVYLREAVKPEYATMEQLQHALEDDVPNKLMHVVHHNSTKSTGTGKFMLAPGDAYYQIGTNLVSFKQLHMVCWIGASGSGKSSLIRTFLPRDGPRPVPGASGELLNGSYASTSCDVHAYVCPMDDGVPWLHVDSEGLYGSETPLGYAVTAYARARSLARAVGDHIVGGGDDDSAAYKRYRVEMRDVGIPRIFYHTASIMCFVVKGSPREAQQMEVLLKYGEQAAIASGGFMKPPALIIIFNNASADQIAKFADPRQATEALRTVNHVTYAALHRLYSGVHACFIPDATEQFLAFRSQQQALSSLCYDIVRSRRVVFSPEVKLRLLSECMDIISADMRAPFTSERLVRALLGADDADKYERCAVQLVRNTEMYATSIDDRPMIWQRMMDHMSLAFRLLHQRDGPHHAGAATTILGMTQISKHVNAHSRCTAVHLFPGHTKAVQCNIPRWNHDDSHRAVETYQDSLDTMPLLSRMWSALPWVKVDEHPCAWEGSFEGPAFSFDPETVSLATPVSLHEARAFLHEHHSSAYGHGFCICCILQPALQVLPCHHILCKACLEFFDGLCPVEDISYMTVNGR
jgi:hypothetical protein